MRGWGCEEVEVKAGYQPAAGESTGTTKGCSTFSRRAATDGSRRFLAPVQDRKTPKSKSRQRLRLHFQEQAFHGRVVHLRLTICIQMGQTFARLPLQTQHCVQPLIRWRCSLFSVSAPTLPLPVFPFKRGGENPPARWGPVP